MNGLPFLQPDDEPQCMDTPWLFDWDFHGVPPTDALTDVREICGDCPFQAECADWGIRHEAHGVWGGLVPKERETLRRAQRIKLQTPTVINAGGQDWVNTLRRESERKSRSALYFRDERAIAGRKALERYNETGHWAKTGTAT